MSRAPTSALRSSSSFTVAALGGPAQHAYCSAVIQSKDLRSRSQEGNRSSHLTTLSCRPNMIAHMSGSKPNSSTAVGSAPASSIAAEMSQSAK
eukprot:6407525-Prymnesium_polylepis.1